MRGTSILLAALGVLAAAASAVAQDYPARPITLVVPFAPGGSASTATLRAAVLALPPGANGTTSVIGRAG